MRLKNIKLGIALASIFFVTHLTAQNNNVVSAALEYQKFEPALMQQNMADAKKHLLEAKKLIDLAVVNDATKNDPKAHYYNVLINFGLVSLSALDEDKDLEVYQNDSIKGVIEASVKIASSKGRWKKDLEDYFNRQVSQAVMLGEMMFKQNKFDMAFAGFASAYQIKDIAGIEEEKDAMKTNSIISALRYIDTLSRTNEKEKAMEFTTSVLEMFPDSEDLAIAGVNLALDQNDLAKAETFFGVAAEASPENKALFSSMGSIYLTEADKAYSDFAKIDITDPNYQSKSDEVEELYGKAETNLKRAIKIDPEYAEASYNLGVLYLGRGEKLKNAAGQMDFNNPDYDKVMAKSKEMYAKAIEPLETYIKHDPNNVGVLNVLFQVHRNAGNDDKALEYKKRADALGQ